MAEAKICVICLCICMPGSAASVPALLACLSRRPCSISSSSFRVRSSSSLSRLFPSSRMRTRKSLTSSDPSASCEGAIVVILFVYLFPSARRTTRTNRVTPNGDKQKNRQAEMYIKIFIYLWRIESYRQQRHQAHSVSGRSSDCFREK